MGLRFTQIVAVGCLMQRLKYSGHGGVVSGRDQPIPIWI